MAVFGSMRRRSKPCDVAERRYAASSDDDARGEAPRVYTDRYIVSARRSFLLLSFINSIALLCIITSGVWYTYLNGLPTISHLMATDFTINTVVAAFILLHILVRTYLIASYTSSAHVFTHISERDHPKTKHRLRIYSNVSMCLYFLQVFFLMLIPVIPVTSYPVEHYVCAVIGIVASILNETVLLERRRFVHSRIYLEQITKYVKGLQSRQSTYYGEQDDDEDDDISVTTEDEGSSGEDDRRPRNSYIRQNDQLPAMTRASLFEQHFLYQRYHPLLACNLVLVLGSYVCAGVFAGFLTFHPSQDVTVFTPISFAEYVLFFLISLLPAFHIMDIYRPLVLPV